MKSILIWSLLLISINSFSQEVHRNFKIDQSEIYWQKIYYEVESIDDLYSKVVISCDFENVEKDLNTISATFNGLSVDHKGAGHSKWTMPIYLRDSFIEGKLIIELKPNKYRVTIRNIKCISKYDTSLTESEEKSCLEDFSVNRKDNFKSLFKRSASEILDFSFNKLLEFKENNDW